MSLGPATLVAVVVSDLVETAIYASVAGIGIAVVFSLALYGVTKSIDYARAERRGASLAAGALGLVALAACLSGVGYGLFIMTTG